MTGGDPRTRLREAALDLFGRRGVQATSTRSILEAAGMKNPSAISYHFGSKAGLVGDLVTEVLANAWPLLQLQVDLFAAGPVTIEEWAGVTAESAATLVSTERGCLLARLIWEYDCVLYPDAFEEFLASGHPMADAWQQAIVATFRDLPPIVAVGRNLVMIRMIEWLISRRAAKVLTGKPAPALKVTSPDALRSALFELSLALLSAPTTLVAQDLIVE
jgi:TetR/AcrR family transcriptional regulator, regulator of cefoperazone and chloramphenicol sensitivity